MLSLNVHYPCRYDMSDSLRYDAELCIIDKADPAPLKAGECPGFAL